MQPLEAQVKNGRLVLDEPTELPEGEVVYLQPVERIVADAPDALDDEERGELRERRVNVASLVPPGRSSAGYGRTRCFAAPERH